MRSHGVLQWKGSVDMKLKRKLVYSAVMTVIPFVLLIALTLGWFSDEIISNADLINLHYAGTTVDMYRSVDEDGNGIPDEDEDGTKYVSTDGENLVFKPIYPGYSVKFKISMSATSLGGFLHGYLNGVYDDESNAPENMTKAMRIKYTPLGETAEVNYSFFEIMETQASSPNLTLFDAYRVYDGNTVDFEFTVYMDETVEGEFYDDVLVIEKILFYVEQ